MTSLELTTAKLSSVLPVTASTKEQIDRGHYIRINFRFLWILAVPGAGREEQRIAKRTSRVHLAISAPNSHIEAAAAFRQMKRTVLLPTRIVRAWPRQPNFQT